MTGETETAEAGLAWQTGVWDRIADIYAREIDIRFAPVVAETLRRAGLSPGERVLDLGTGTGSVAVRAAPLVAAAGQVVAIDISSEMVSRARRRAAQLGFENITFREGRAEEIPAADREFDCGIACLVMMYAIDRPVAAREIARVLRPGGRFVGTVWAAPEQCDIVLFQQTAGKFAPAPPVPGVGPGALADPSTFVAQLADAGIDARVERKTLGFDFDSFDLAWQVLAGVTTAQLEPERREEAKEAVKAVMWPKGDGPRHFRNVTQFIVGRRK